MSDVTLETSVENEGGTDGEEDKPCEDEVEEGEEDDDGGQGGDQDVSQLLLDLIS